MSNPLTTQTGRRASSHTASAARWLEARAVELDPRYRRAWLRLVWCDAEAASNARVRGDLVGAESALRQAEESRSALARVDPEGAYAREAELVLARARQGLERVP